MKKNEIISHLTASFFYFLALSVLRLKIDAGLVFLWLGGLFGTFLLDIDHFLYWFVVHPEKEDSVVARRILLDKSMKLKGKLKEWYLLLEKWHFTHRRLIFHTALFQVILLVLAFYIISSGGSFFGSGLVMAACLHLLKDEWQDYQKDKERLADWLFWQIKGIPVQKYLKLYLAAASLIFAGLSLLLI